VVIFLKGRITMRKIILTSIISALIVGALGAGCSSSTETSPVKTAPKTDQPAGTPAPKSEQLRTAKYIIAGSEIYEAALRDDSARVLRLCQQMDESLQEDEADQSRDHDLLVAPCNLVVRGNSALSIKSQMVAMIPAAEAHKQETVVAIDTQGISDNAKSSYRISYKTCADDPARIYQESGTNNVEAAARWMSETWLVGVIRDNGYQGCLDGLLGKPSKLVQ